MQFSHLSLLLALLGTALAGPGIKVSRVTPSGRYDLPLTWAANGFLSSIKLGTPELALPVLMDWTWMNTYVLSPRCYHQENASLCIDPAQLLYDPLKSSTFQNLTTQYATETWLPNHFFGWLPITAEYASDKIWVGSVSTNVVIQLSDFEWSLEGITLPFSAVLGFSPVFRGDRPDFESSFYQQWQAGAWSTPLIGFVYCYDAAKKSSVCGGNDALQSLGGIHNELIKGGTIYWYDVREYPDVNTLDFEYKPGFFNYWATELDQLKIGNEVQSIAPTSQDSGKGAIFDHASYGRGAALTADAYQRLVSLTGGTPVTLAAPPNNGNQSFYSVDCTKTASFPTLSYTFCGNPKEWEITPQNYVANVNGTCVLNIRVLSTGNRFIGNFGETFLMDKYITFDFENLRIGLADIQW